MTAPRLSYSARMELNAHNRQQWLEDEDAGRLHGWPLVRAWAAIWMVSLTVMAVAWVIAWRLEKGIDYVVEKLAEVMR